MTGPRKLASAGVAVGCPVVGEHNGTGHELVTCALAAGSPVPHAVAHLRMATIAGLPPARPPETRQHKLRRPH